MSHLGLKLCVTVMYHMRVNVDDKEVCSVR